MSDDFDPNDPYVDTKSRQETRAEILELYKTHKQLTPTEVSRRLGVNILCARPQITMLAKAGYLRMTEAKQRTTALHRWEHVWELVNENLVCD